MIEPTIICPSCSTEIKVTESLAAPLIESTVGMYGDLQGIAGRALQEIEGLEVPLIESDIVDDDPTSL